MNIIKRFDNDTALGFDKGKFDSWCVYFIDTNGRKTPPQDTDYFAQIREYGKEYGIEKVYGDRETLIFITELATTYNNNYEADVLFTTLYMAMVAEENKKYTKLGKRIKRLGIYKVLIENSPIIEAANIMRGMKWYDIDILCKERGF
jgi:hypothetical protein